MKDVYTINDLEQVKALADPFRLRIMSALKGDRLLTAKQIADQLGEKPTKLYHHVEMLESLGLIRLVETRQVRGIVEKYYQAVAKAIAVDPKVFAGEEGTGVSDAVASMFMSVIETIRNEAQNSITNGLIGASNDSDPVLIHLPMRVTKKQIEKIKQRLELCVAEVRRETGNSGDANYSLVVAFYPSENNEIQK